MKKFLSLVLALTMMMSLVTINAGAKEFTDDEELNYKEAVDVISEISVVDGYEDGSFKPQNTLTRGAAAKIICNLILGPTTAAELHADTAPYKDVPVSNTFSGYIAYCAKEGIISGYADGSFRPAGTLTGYAFMKMLLGALGYDATYEGYTGGNWSINVAKQAIGIGLNKGLVDEFNGVDFVTREEAALYAFNTLKATMVDYDQKITTNVNGVDVTISQGNAKPVTWTEGINEDGNIKDDDFVQFAEEFFPKLVRKDDNDKFMAPANTWVYDKSEIGTYERTDLIVETYTTKVTGKDAYDLLKSGVIKDNDLEVYVDGVVPTGSELFDKDDMVRSNTSKLGATGDGVLTKVYLDTDKDVITFVSINTWLAKATADYSESKEYAPLSVYTGIGTTKTYNVDVEDVANVTDVAKDTFYQVNISKKDNTNGEVVILKDVEVLEDSTVTKFSSSDEGKGTGKVTKLTTGGEEYKANVKAFYDKDVLNEYDQTLLTDNTYNVYVDANGYFIGVELFEGTKNYVFITGFDRNSSNLSVKTATAGAIFLDGTMKNIEVNVTDTDKNIDKATGHNAAYFKEWADTSWQTGRGDNGVYNLNQWYTYTENNGVYTLKPCVRMTATQYLPDAEHPVAGYGTDTKNDSIRTDNLSVVDDLTANNRVYGEDDTIFLTVDLDVVDTTNGVKKAITDVTGVYTGVQNVDIDINVEDSEAIGQRQVFTVYDSDYYVIGAVVIGEARGATANYAYIISGAKSEEKKDDTYYWEFDAVLAGEKQTLTAKSKYKSTISELVPGTVQELRFDGDYVASIKKIDKVYEDFTSDKIEDFDVYAMTEVNANNTPNTLMLQGRTLYVTANRRDVGLGLAAGAKAVTIQDENKETKVATNFSDVASAIAHLADAQPNTDGFQYDGKVFAVLNDNGTAEWVVFVNDTALQTGTNNNQGGGSGALYNYNSMVTEWGQAYVSLTYNRPAYVPASTTVTYNFDVFADGVWIDSATGSLSGNAARWQGFAKPGAKIELRNVVLTPAAVSVKYVDENGAAVSLDSTGTNPTTLSTSGTPALKVALDDAIYEAGTYKYTVTGLTTDVAETSDTTLGSDVTVSNVAAKGNDYVTVKFTGLVKKAVTYGITLTDVNTAAAKDLEDFGVNPTTYSTDKDATLSVDAVATTGIVAGTPVDFTVKLGTAPADADAYRVVISKLGIDGYVDKNNLSITKRVVVNDNITIGVADVVVTPVELPTIQSVTWNESSITINFNKQVIVKTGAFTEATFNGNTSLDEAVKDATNGDKVYSITYTVANGTLAAGDTVTITNANVTGAQHGGVLKTASTTLTLASGGTATGY